MPLPDEPFIEPEETSTQDAPPDAVAPRIRRLLESQSFGVLCTQGEGQPYGSLVAYAFDDTLTSVIFATSKATRKFRLLSQCGHVALVVDNRPDFPDELMRVEAVTATGHAEMLEDAEQREVATRFLLGRHPYLSHFVRSDSCGLFRIDVVRFLHVCHFQEVRQWIPTRNS